MAFWGKIELGSGLGFLGNEGEELAGGGGGGGRRKFENFEKWKWRFLLVRCVFLVVLSSLEDKGQCNC